MKKTLLLSGMVLLSTAFASGAISSPPVAERHEVFAQADGTRVTLMRFGDARFHWLETRAGEVVIKNPATGNYEYAKIEKENGRPTLVPSGIPVASAGGQDKSAGDFTPVKRKDLIPLRKAAVKKFKQTKPNESQSPR